MDTATNWLGKLRKNLAKPQGTQLSRIEIEYDAGFGNQLYLRGEGAGLSWEKGIPLINQSNNQWVWETRGSFDRCHFKILINDVQYEIGENHLLTYGGTIRYIPKF